MIFIGKETTLSPRALRRSRLGTGLVIFLFVAMHLANHALGLVSIPVAEAGRRLFSAIWRNPVGTTLFYGAVFLHMALTLRSIYVRRSMVMPLGEAAQIVVGLAIPLLLIQHVVGTRIASALFSYADTYRSVVTTLWLTAPEYGLQQGVALLAVWVHGCLGLHFWLRYRWWYQDLKPALLALAILVPVLSLLGFVEMGRTLADPLYVAENPTYMARNSSFYENTDAQNQLRMIRDGLYLAYFASLGAVWALRAHRRFQERLNQVAIHYQGGETVRIPKGFTVLEASRVGGIVHFSACGGKGRCSTCRIQILKDAHRHRPPDKLESATLERINAGPDVRLACQFRPEHDVTIAPLLTRAAATSTPIDAEETSPGREREIVVLFCDLRNFTTLASQRLPFDTVFLLNRYFALVGRSVEQAGGRLDKFIGDGAMALFGLSTSPEEACRQAIAAAARIEAGIRSLNDELGDELETPLRIAIAIHTGAAVVGTIGYGTARNLTAVGDTVNVASRLEHVAKEFDAAIVLSEAVVDLAGISVANFLDRRIQVRGRAEPLRVFVVEAKLAPTLVGGVAE